MLAWVLTSVTKCLSWCSELNMKTQQYLSIILITIALSGLCKISLAQEATVRVGGEVVKPYVVDQQMFSAMKQLHVKVTGRDSVQHDYSGVSLYEVITKAGAVAGNKLSGKELTKYVLITAADGYKVVIAMAEIDPGFTDQHILLVNQDNGENLAANYGPYRLIVPGDKRPARSVMRVVAIEVFAADKK